MDRQSEDDFVAAHEAWSENSGDDTPQLSQPRPEPDTRYTLAVYLPVQGGEPGEYWTGDVLHQATHLGGLQAVAGRWASDPGQIPSHRLQGLDRFGGLVLAVFDGRGQFYGEWPIDGNSPTDKSLSDSDYASLGARDGSSDWIIFRRPTG